MANTDPTLRVVASDLDPDEELLRKLRLDPSQLEAAVEIPVSLQCKKPSKRDFVRVHPSWELTVRAIELMDGDSDGGLYVVAPDMTAALQEESGTYCLRPYLNRSGVLRLWPIKLPDADGRQNEWHRTAAVAAAAAARRWVRVTASRSLGGYRVFEAAIQPPDPEWPPLTFPQMLRLAFEERGRVIENHEHPVVKQLLGRL